MKIIFPFLFFFLLSIPAHAATTYSLYIPTVWSGLPVTATTTGNLLQCNGVGGWSKNPTYETSSSTLGVNNVVFGENTYTFTSGSNIYTSFSAVTSAFGSGEYLFNCVNPTKIVWYSSSGVPKDDFLIKTPVVINGSEYVYDDLYDTRFLSVSATTTAPNYVTFNTTYFLDLSEISTTTNSRNIQLIGTSVAGGSTIASTTFFGGQSDDILPLTNGTSTVSINYVTYLPDGYYEVRQSFTNYPSIFNDDGLAAFPRAEAYATFQVLAGIVGNFTQTQITDTRIAAGVTTGSSGICPNFVAWNPITYIQCIPSVVAFLFIPQPQAMNTLVWYSNASTSPATAYLAYGNQRMNQSLAIGQSATTTVSSLNMSIPITVNNATMTLPIVNFTEVDDKMGGADEVFRAVALAALVLFAISVYIGNVQRAMYRIAFLTAKD